MNAKLFRKSDFALLDLLDIHKDPGSGCWLLGYKLGGYNRRQLCVEYRGRHLNMRRLIWAKEIGPLKPKQCLRTVCNNASCFAPAHQELTSHVELSRRSRLEVLARKRKEVVT